MERSARSTVAVLATVSALTLTYEVMQTRIFSFSLHPVVAFTAIAIAMLGFGLGATLLAVRPSLLGGDRPGRMAWACIGLAASIVVIAVFFAHTSRLVMTVGTLKVNLLWAAVVLLPCIAPYLLAGLITATILEASVERIGRAYFWNLAGSAAGCAIAIPLLRPLGAERVVALTAVAAAAAALISSWRSPGAARWASAGAIVAGLAVVPFAPALMPFQPDSNEAMTKMEVQDGGMGRPAPVREFTEWDPLGRIDVVRHGRPEIYVSEPTGFRTVTIDGGAMTLIIEDTGEPGWGKALFEDSVYAAPYRLKERPDVLVIGVGGGSDINTALHWNARSVTGIEISLGTIHALTGPYSRFAGWPERKDVVRLVHCDGRSFVKSTRERFDILQMSGVDTFTMHSAGSMVLAEDYLYTVDAFVDYFEVLKPGGILSVARFGDEGMSLAAIAARALRKAGIEDPADHIVVMRQMLMSSVLVKLEPFTAEEMSAITGMEARTRDSGIIIPHYDAMGIRLGLPIQLLHPAASRPDRRYDRYFAALADGREGEALRDLGVPFVVPTDDRPFYMLGSWVNILKREKESKNDLPRLVATSSAVTAAAALLLALLPAIAIRRRSGAGGATMAATVAYFFALGAAFMLLEMCLIHRTVVFVGTPGASVTVVLTSILVSSGAGAWASERTGWRLSRRLLAALAGAAIAALVHAYAMGAILEPLHGLSMLARSVAAALLIAPAGFFMGWFFPTGMCAISARHRALVPWAIAVNGFASVIGSLALLPLSMAVGFRIVFVIAVLIYAAGVAAILPIARKAS